VFRFANRIPLLFEPGSDVVTRQAADVEWGRYKIDKSTAKIGVFVSIVSTRIPFRGTGKEHIAEDVKELAEEVRKALQACGSQLAKKLAKRAAAKARKARRKALARYIPDAARAVFGVLAKARPLALWLALACSIAAPHALMPSLPVSRAADCCAR
jgi:DNA topoisomerase-6 subunit B